MVFIAHPAGQPLLVEADGAGISKAVAGERQKGECGCDRPGSLGFRSDHVSTHRVASAARKETNCCDFRR